MTILAVAPDGADAVDDATLREKHGVLASWFERHGAIAALVRPDHYVFGAAANLDALHQQIQDLGARLV